MAKDDDAKDEEKGGGKGKLIIMLLPTILLVLGGVYFVVLKPDPAAAGPVELPPPVPGAVKQLDPITINLAGGHFLKLGMALQPTAAAGEEVSGAKALDLAITEFSGMTIEELSTGEGREQAKAELLARVKLAYLPEGEAEKAEGSSDGSSDQESSSDSESSDNESSSNGETSGSSHSSKSSGESGPAGMTGAMAIKKAAKLEVQPEVYELYFTEFVMQ